MPKLDGSAKIIDDGDQQGILWRGQRYVDLTNRIV